MKNKPETDTFIIEFCNRHKIDSNEFDHLCHHLNTNYKSHAWVPTSERLPENNQSVLFCTSYKDKDYQNIRKGLFMIEDQWGRTMFCDGSFHTVAEIPYWMPTPGPPQIHE